MVIDNELATALIAHRTVKSWSMLWRATPNACAEQYATMDSFCPSTIASAGNKEFGHCYAVFGTCADGEYPLYCLATSRKDNHTSTAFFGIDRYHINEAILKHLMPAKWRHIADELDNL